MEFTIEQIAYLLDGTISGDSGVKISRLEKIQEATAGCIAFLENPKYEPFLYTTKASAVIVHKDFIPKQNIATTLILVENPRLCFTTLLEEYYKILSFSKKGIEQPSFIGNNSVTGQNIFRAAFSYIGNQCRIGDNVKIYPHVYIGDNVVIGNNTILYSGVKIYADCVIGSYCTFQSGAVIGSDGFGFAPLADGSYKTVPQIGNVIIEDHVDIGANTVVDCATLGSTIIKKGVKLDNLIQIAHNVEIGMHTVIAAQSGVSGSTQIGDYCVFGGQVGIVGHISIADKTKVGAQSGISKTISTPALALQGSPAFDYKQNLKSISVFKKLPQLLKRIEELEQKIVNLTSL